MIVGDDGPNGRPPTPACPINSRQPASRMNWLGTRYASLLRLPACIGNREADTAGLVTSGPCMLFGKEEDTVFSCDMARLLSFGAIWIFYVQVIGGNCVIQP